MWIYMRRLEDMAFEQVRPQVNFPKLEAEILQLWERTGAFEKSVEQRPSTTSG